MDHPNIKFPPPLIFLIFLILGIGLNSFFPLPLFQGFLKIVLGLIFSFLAIIIGAYSFWLFKKNKTEVFPWKPTSKIIKTGPYKYSRNPMYLSIVFLGIGLSFFLSNAWILGMMIPFLITIDRLVVRKEEEYLLKKFGSEYQDYLTKVRRWI
jgi:protein-S-isoprenylcysteine O-methyltransferase Ste14